MNLSVDLNSVIVHKRDDRNYHVDFRLEGVQPDFETILAFDEAKAQLIASLSHSNVYGGVFCELCGQQVTVAHSPCLGYTTEIIAKVLEVADVERPNWRVYKITH